MTYNFIIYQIKVFWFRQINLLRSYCYQLCVALVSIVVPPPYLIELFQRRTTWTIIVILDTEILSFSQCVFMCFHIVFNIIFVTMLYIAHNVSILLVSTNVFLQISQMRVNHSKKCMVTWLSCPDNLVIVDRFLLLWLLLF